MRCNMKCQKYHELISAFIDNELTTKETLKLKRHLKSCDSCKEEMKIMSKLQYEFQKEGQSRIAPQSGEDFSLRVMNVIRTLPVEKKKRFLPLFNPLQALKDWFASIDKKPVLAYSFSGMAVILFIGFMLFNSIDKNEMKTVYELAQVTPTAATEQREDDVNYYVREYAINASHAGLGIRDGIIESVNYEIRR
jgi:hypothetical protein